MRGTVTSTMRGREDTLKDERTHSRGEETLKRTTGHTQEEEVPLEELEEGGHYYYIVGISGYDPILDISLCLLE